MQNAPDALAGYDILKTKGEIIMKTRIISAMVALPLLAVVLVFQHTYVLNGVLSLICGMAIFEMLHNTKYVTNKGLLISSIIFAMFVPFSNVEILKPYFAVIVMAYVGVLLAVLFIKHKTLPFGQVAVSFTASFLISYALSSLVFLRDAQPAQSKMGLYYILLVLICAWISDTGAYFTGVIFGRHKLCPNISPKKTIEGVVGGVLFCVIITIAFTYVYCDIIAKSGVETSVNLFNLLWITLAASLVGVVGDLTFSIVKRQVGIKDYGKIMPGHGGVLDRFDSILLIAPFLYMILQFFSVVEVL